MIYIIKKLSKNNNFEIFYLYIVYNLKNNKQKMKTQKEMKQTSMNIEKVLYDKIRLYLRAEKLGSMSDLIGDMLLKYHNDHRVEIDKVLKDDFEKFWGEVR